MFVALAVALALPGGMNATIQVPAGDLLGKVPAEVAALMRIESSRAEEVAAVKIAGGHQIVVANPDQWLQKSSICGHDGWGQALALGISGSYGRPNFVFIDGRLAHVKAFAADYLASATDDIGDLGGEQLVSVVCHKVSRPRLSEIIFFGPILAPYAAERGLQIGIRHKEGLSLLSQFKVGAAAPNIRRLRADHADALSVESQADGHDRVRIRYGAGDIGGDPHPDQVADCDFYIELIDGKVASIRQGYLMRAQCKLASEGAMVCD